MEVFNFNYEVRKSYEKFSHLIVPEEKLQSKRCPLTQSRCTLKQRRCERNSADMLHCLFQEPVT